jgi:hypothetical protein
MSERGSDIEAYSRPPGRTSSGNTLRGCTSYWYDPRLLSAHPLVRRRVLTAYLSLNYTNGMSTKRQ